MSQCSAINSPYAVACSTVAPAALHLTETCDAALLPAETAARPVDEIDARLWVYREVEEQTHHLSVSQNIRLGWT